MVPTIRRPLTVKQAADALGVHPDTVRRWCDSNMLASSRSEGGHRRISWADLESFVGRQSEARPEDGRARAA